MFKKLLSFKRKEKEASQEFAFLKKIPFLLNMRNSEIRLFSKLLIKRQYRKDEYIFKQDFPHTVLYFIASGEVEIIIDKNVEKPIRLATLSACSHFGEIGLFVDSKRTASAKAISNVILYAISKTDFHAFVHKFPRVGVKLLYNMGQNLSLSLIQSNQSRQKNEN